MALLLDLPNELLFEITHYLTHNEIFNFLRANWRLARLHRTAQFDRLRRFRSLPHGRKALFHAAAQEDTATVVELVRIGAHEFTTGKAQFLNLAIQDGCSAKAITVFLRCGIEVEGTDIRGRTPLAIAAREGHTEIVKVLLNEEGIRINAQCQDGRTPFMFAALAGHASVVRLLLEDERVDVGLRDAPPLANPVVAHSTLLLRVAAAGLYEVAKLLLESPRIDHETELLGSNSRTVLCKAVETGNRRVIKLLLDDGRSDPNFLSSGETPLHYAVRAGRPEAVRLLLADPRIDVHKVSALGITPIHLAARQKYKPLILETLLRDGRADVNARNPRGETPLFTAVIANARACVKLLLEVEGIDLSTANNNGLTPMMAARSHHPMSRAVVNMLKESIDKQNEKSRMEAQLLEPREESERPRKERLELQARDLQTSAVSAGPEVQVQEVGGKVKRKRIGRFGPRLAWLTRIFVRRQKANI